MSGQDPDARSTHVVSDVDGGRLSHADSTTVHGDPHTGDSGSRGFESIEEQAGVYGGRASMPQGELSASRTASKESLRVLVVDDDAPILELIQLILQTGGYRCIAARSGREAISVFEQRGSDIGVLITDFSMPGIDGAALVHVLREIRPELPCIGMSGSDTGSDVDLWRGQSIVHVEKPFSSRDLLSAVARIFPRAS